MMVFVNAAILWSQEFNFLINLWSWLFI